jgi:cell surface protein SprA
MKMFIHAEGVDGEKPLQNGDLRAFIRLGSDFVSNYYEYQIPLKVTPSGSFKADVIWPTENEMTVRKSSLSNFVGTLGKIEVDGTSNIRKDNPRDFVPSVSPTVVTPIIR